MKSEFCELLRERDKFVKAFDKIVTILEDLDDRIERLEGGK